MFINDVGQSTWEEINVGRAGANYGWPTTEGATSAAGYDSPLFTYGHSSNRSLVTGIAIVGGAFYRPATVMFPSGVGGELLLRRLVAGWVNRLDRANGNAVYAFARLGYLTDVRGGSGRSALCAGGASQLGGLSVQQAVGTAEDGRREDRSYCRVTVSGPTPC